jgi:hypothetical protein
VPEPRCVRHADRRRHDARHRLAEARRHRPALGPGRHTAGNNTFSYFSRPAGFAVEYTSELVAVDDETHVAEFHEAKDDAVDQWGIAQGGPHTMPKPVADSGLFVAPPI